MSVSRESKVRRVFDLLLDGRSESEIVETISDEWPNEDPAPLIVTATGYLSDPALDDGILLTRWAIAATQRIYRRALDGDDLGVALRSAAQIANLADRLPRIPDRDAGETPPPMPRAPRTSGGGGTLRAHGRGVSISEL